MSELPFGTFRINGKSVTEAEFKKNCIGGDGLPSVQSGNSKGWPMVSEAMAVHPEQVAEARAEAIHRGVPTEYRDTGEPVLRSKAHRDRFKRAYGYHDRNSYNG